MSSSTPLGTSSVGALGVTDGTPQGGEHVLQIRETTGGGTDGIIGWQIGLTAWDGKWTFSRLFYSQNVPLNSDFQGHDVILYDSPDANDSPLKVHLGSVDSRCQKYLITGTN